MKEGNIIMYTMQEIWLKGIITLFYKICLVFELKFKRIVEW